MKKILYATLLFIIILPTMVLAIEQNDSYFITYSGVELTKEQYDNLIQHFSHDTIYSMSEELLNKLKDDDKLDTTTDTKYIKTITNYPGYRYEEIYSEEVTEEEYNSYQSALESGIDLLASDSQLINYRAISLSATWGNRASAYVVTFTSKWNACPATRSFDIFAVSSDWPSTITEDVRRNRSGYQKYDNQIINYAYNSGNWKDQSGGFNSFETGMSLSQNLVDSAQGYFENSITVYFPMGKNRLLVLQEHISMLIRMLV